MFFCARQRLSSCRRFSRFPCDLAAILFSAILLVSPSLFAQDNGISVGQPKVYDNQSLTIMLDELTARLHQVQTIDPQALAKALGLTQGSQQQDVTREFNASVSLTPKALTDSAAAPSSSASNSSKTSTGNNSSSASNSSSSSALPELLAAPAYKPDYGENSIDLLSDQVDLSYQIFNLRMMLERAVSDRLWDNSSAARLVRSPRRQAVVSFNISLDPPAYAHDAAAYVEITLSTAKGPMSLVASMPQEKTYNATSLSSSSNAFGGSAVAKIISVSYNQRKRSQTFFLYRDSDTLALERPAAPNSPNSVTFGWVFRPVLGRRSVSPGMRQMFAVIALPESDVLDDKTSEENGSPQLNVQAKTYWLHYDKNTSTTVSHPGFWDWSAKALPAPVSFPLSPIPVLPTNSIDTALNPVIRYVQLLQTTSGNSVLLIDGENFFTGTTVSIGDKTFSGPQDGLFIKSSQTIFLPVSADLLSRSFRAVINGRYGRAVPVIYNQPPADGIVIAKSKLAPNGPNYTTLEVIVGNSDPTRDLSVNDMKNFPAPILMLNGAQSPYRPTLVDTRDAILDPSLRTYIVASIVVPNSLIHPRDNRVGIIFPLLGESWSAEDLIYDADEVQVTKMTSGPTTTVIISRPGIPFSKDWSLILDKSYPLIDPPPPPPPPEPAPDKKAKKKPPVPTPPEFSSVVPCGDPKASHDKNQCYMLKIVADTKFLSSFQKFILVSDRGHAQVLDMPAAAPPKEAPAVPPKPVSIAPATVGLNEVVTVTITGTGLDAVKQVSFDGKPLTFWAVPDKEKSSDAASAPPDATAAKPSQILVLLSRDVTRKEGRQELLLQVDAKNMATIALVVAPSPTATKSPSK
jgi:hypothetical protein